jgi:thiazole synthase
MELGADGILLNTAVAQSNNPAQMAYAMNLGVQAGRFIQQVEWKKNIMLI